MTSSPPPAGGFGSVVPAPTSFGPMPTATSNDRLAKAAFYAGLAALPTGLMCSLGVVLAFMAVVTGVTVLRKGLPGTGYATTGIVSGVLSLLAWAISLIPASFLPAVTGP